MSFGEDFHNHLLDHSETVFELPDPFSLDQYSRTEHKPIVSVGCTIKTMFSADSVVKAVRQWCSDEANAARSSLVSPVGTVRFHSSYATELENVHLNKIIQELEAPLSWRHPEVISAKYQLGGFLLRNRNVCGDFCLCTLGGILAELLLLLRVCMMTVG